MFIDIFSFDWQCIYVFLGNTHISLCLCQKGVSLLSPGFFNCSGETKKTVVKRAYSVFYCWFLCNFSGFCTLFRFCQKGVCTFLFRIFIKYFHRRCVWVSGFQICNNKKMKRAYLAVIRPFDKDTEICSKC